MGNRHSRRYSKSGGLAAEDLDAPEDAAEVIQEEDIEAIAAHVMPSFYIADAEVTEIDEENVR
jgi:hypothetical protein